MRFQTTFTFLMAVGSALAQGVTDKIAPEAASPANCKPVVDGKFEIAIVPLGDVHKREFFQHEKREIPCAGSGILVSTLSDGVIKDAENRVGYIASNFQFQFDGPPQAGAIYTAGFSKCDNGSLALGSSTVFYQCKSGDFYNLYDRWWAEQCSPVEIMVIPCGQGAREATVVAQKTIGTSVVPTTVVVPLGDGQPQVITTTAAIPMCQIDDGQVQGHTTPCAALTAAPVPTNPGAPVSQFSDGQIQVTPVSQYPDGQIQVTTGTAAVPQPPKPSSAPAPVVPNGTTLRTTAPLPPPSVVPTNAPPTNNAGRFQLGSAVAFFISLAAALWAL